MKTFDQNIRYYRHLIEVIERKTNIQNNFFFLIKLFIHLFDDQTGIILKLLLIKFSIFFVPLMSVQYFSDLINSKLEKKTECLSDLFKLNQLSYYELII